MGMPQNYIKLVVLEFFATLFMKSTFIWDMMPFWLIICYLFPEEFTASMFKVCSYLDYGGRKFL
jgi:hypothetical protein